MAIVKTGHQTTYYEYLNEAPKPSGRRRDLAALPTLVKSYPSGKKKWACVYNVPPVPLYDDKTVEDFIRPCMHVLDDAFHRGIMPPTVPDDIRAWKGADYCSVSNVCADLERAAA